MDARDGRDGAVDEPTAERSHVTLLEGVQTLQSSDSPDAGGDLLIFTDFQFKLSWHMSHLPVPKTIQKTSSNVGGWVFYFRS